MSVTDGRVTIGAMTREYMAEESETVAETVPLLAAALPLIGHEAIRSRGTIGGSLAHADPAAELPAVARALDAEFVVRSQSGERVIPAAEWFEGYLTTSRRPDEILVEVRFPVAEPGTGVAFQEVARRHGDFAMVGLAASLTLADGAISDARLAFSGVADVPVRAAEAEGLLVGEQPSAELFEEAARRATAELDPPADLHGVVGLPEEGRGRPGPPRAARGRGQRLREAVTDDGHHRDGERRPAHRLGGGAQDAGRLPARGPRSHRHPRRLRARGLRRVHGDRRRQAGALVPDAGRAGRGPRGDARSRGWRRTAILGPLQQAMWESHSFQCGFCTPGFVMQTTAFLERPPGRRGAGDPRGAVRQHLPLHRLPEHRRRRAAGRASGSRDRPWGATR